MKEYLVGMPSPTEQTRFIPAHMMYCIRDGRLLRERSPLSLHGGLMAVGRVTGALPDASALADQLVRECLRLDFSGVLLALPPVPTTPCAALAETVAQRCAAKRLNAYLPMTYASFAPEARLLVPGMIAAGSFFEYLHALCQKHGRAQLALELCCEALDFSMPVDHTPGKYLPPDALHSLLDATGAMTFYSSVLCCNYFTYADAQGQTHFVVFDTAESLRSKRDVARTVGLGAVFYLIPPGNEHALSKLER